MNNKSKHLEDKVLHKTPFVSLIETSYLNRKGHKSKYFLLKEKTKHQLSQ